MALIQNRARRTSVNFTPIVTEDSLILPANMKTNLSSKRMADQWVNKVSHQRNKMQLRNALDRMLIRH